jgi:histone-lysine N-methyltransferase SETMAR
MHCEKMAVTDMSFRQRDVTEFPVKEGNSAGVTRSDFMKWHHTTSPKKRKQKTVPSASKVMGAVFWDSEGCKLVDFLGKGDTISAARYVQKLKKLRRALREKCPKKKTVILQHENARPHTARLTLQTIQKNGWELLSHPLRSPDLASLRLPLVRALETSPERSPLRD